MSTDAVEFSKSLAKGRKQLSGNRGVILPLEPFNEEKNELKRIEPDTPIQQTLRNRNKSTETLGSPAPIKFRIFLSRMENSAIAENGIELSVDSGKTADIAKFMRSLAKEYRISEHVFSEMFSIWMISPLLEVQLKPYHRPYEGRQGWEYLVAKFGNESSNNSVTSDKPILMLRRNASLTCEREFELLDEHPTCAQLLICSAREMLLLGRLQFLSLDTTIRVTASLFCLQYGSFDGNKHDVPFIRSHIDEILPERSCDAIAAKTIFGKSLSKKTSQEESLLQYWREFSKNPEPIHRERELLLTLTQESSCYGAAWFSGRVEKKTSRASLKNLWQSFAEMEVSIGINDRFLTILDPSGESLLVQAVDDMSWKLETKVENKEQTSFLILNLSCDSHEETKDETTIFLKITGNQTVLIDALLETVAGKKRFERSISDSSSSSDSSTSSSKHSRLIESKVNLKCCSAENNRKLCMAVFKDGKCTEVAGSFKDYYSQGEELMCT